MANPESGEEGQGAAGTGGAPKYVVDARRAIQLLIFHLCNIQGSPSMHAMPCKEGQMLGRQANVHELRQVQVGMHLA
jgi:hypothetical protein